MVSIYMGDQQKNITYCRLGCAWGVLDNVWELEIRNPSFNSSQVVYIDF